MIYNQTDFDIRHEWGMRGLQELAPVSQVIVIVDVLSFSTCVDIATANGSIIYPYQWKDDSAIFYAKSKNAELASPDRQHTDRYSLSPTSLLHIKPGTKLVLPSPNGSTLTLSTKQNLTICGSLRNAEAVATYAMISGKTIAVISAGERWNDQPLRISLEDFIGAGAIISYLNGSLSPESKAALAVFEAAKGDILAEVKHCSSGKELIARGFEEDIGLACELNSSNNIPVLTQDAYMGYRLA